MVTVPCNIVTMCIQIAYRLVDLNQSIIFVIAEKSADILTEVFAFVLVVESGKFFRAR